MQEVSHILVPRTVVIENPEKRVMITIEYSETDVNVPIGDDAFTLPDEGAGAEVR
jgi:hypothetical protein